MWKWIMAVVFAMFSMGLLGCTSNMGKMGIRIVQEYAIIQEPIAEEDTTVEVDFLTTAWDAIWGWLIPTDDKPD